MRKTQEKLTGHKSLGNPVMKAYDNITVLTLLIWMDLLRADFVFWDTPFGLDLAPWDKLLDDPELSMFFKQLNREHLQVHRHCPGGLFRWCWQSQGGNGEGRLQLSPPLIRLQARPKPTGHGLFHFCCENDPHWLHVSRRWTQSSWRRMVVVFLSF